VHKLDLNIGGVSMDKPINAKPKGRTIRSDEVRTVKLGAKEEKKMNRRCKKCGVADGHNSRTCLSVEENRVCLVNLANPRKRGHLPGSRNINTSRAPEWNETTTSKKACDGYRDD
jgi:hypothetical protein